MLPSDSSPLTDGDGVARELTDGYVRQFRQLSQALTLLGGLVVTAGGISSYLYF
jgi:hypothetical protein